MSDNPVKAIRAAKQKSQNEIDKCQGRKSEWQALKTALQAQIAQYNAYIDAENTLIAGHQADIAEYDAAILDLQS
jgi:chromosome segregation ATPase